jgi:hypothetical protein
MARFAPGRFPKRQGWWRMMPSRTPWQRIRRRNMLKRLLRLTETRLGWTNAAGRLLSDFREQIAAALEQEGGGEDLEVGANVEEPYDAAVDSIDTSPTDTVSETPTPSGGGEGRPVTTRALYKVFEEWEAKGGKPTADGYPRINDINAELGEEGYQSASSEVIRAAFDKWAAKGGADEELDKPTQGEVFEAFSQLVGRDVTSTNTPYVKEVNEQLRKEGYRGISQKEVHDLFEKFKRQVRRRPRGRK